MPYVMILCGWGALVSIPKLKVYRLHHPLTQSTWDTASNLFFPKPSSYNKVDLCMTYTVFSYPNCQRKFLRINECVVLKFQLNREPLRPRTSLAWHINMAADDKGNCPSSGLRALHKTVLTISKNFINITSFQSSPVQDGSHQWYPHFLSSFLRKWPIYLLPFSTC